MRTQDAIADFLESARTTVIRYTAGFDDTNHTRQAANLPNHCAWNLGHCALTMHRVAENLDGGGLPPRDFIAGAARGDAERFGTESVSFGSAPTDDPSAYPTLARSIEIFNAAVERLCKGIRIAPDARLSENVPWATMQLPLYLLVMRMASHNAMHAGQIADMRRALGLKSIFT